MVKVDQNKCIGCGLCIGLCPETFKLSADHKSEVINNQSTDCAKEAAGNCPVGAISAE